MKGYHVVFVPEAREEALAAAAYIAETSPMAAVRWYDGLAVAIDELGSFPLRCSVAPESEHLGEELRHVLYKSHRIIIKVEEASRTVRVLHVRHVSRQPLGSPDACDQEDAPD